MVVCVIRSAFRVPCGCVWCAGFSWVVLWILGFLADWLVLLVFVVFLGDAILCGVGII